MEELADGLPPNDGTPIIVSSNRYYDVKPYMDRLYTQEPDKYGSIFPEDLPQPATTTLAKEQKWLRDWFGDREVHVQGGDPDGFRFLKQILTCCALWNACQKVPMMVEHFFAQKANQETLNDPQILKHIRIHGAEPSAFFPGGELKECGERSLRKATDAIVQRIRDWGERTPKQQAATPANVPSETGAAAQSLLADDSVSADPPSDISPKTKTAAHAEMEPEMKTNPHSTQATPILKSRLPNNSGWPEVQEKNDQPPAVIELPHVADDGGQYVPTHQTRRPRGGSIAGRGSMRSNQSQSYHHQPYSDHNQQFQPPQSFGTNLSYGSPGQYNIQNPMRSSSGAPIPFSQQSPQMSGGHQCHFNVGLPQHAPPGLHYPIHQQGRNQQGPGPGLQPIYISHSQMQNSSYPIQLPFGERGNEQYHDAAYNVGPTSYAGNDTYNKRGNRDSKDGNTSRGGRPRGYSSGSVRGKGSRGRNDHQSDFRDAFSTNEHESRHMSGGYHQMPGDYRQPSGDQRQVFEDYRPMSGDARRFSGDARQISGGHVMPPNSTYTGMDRRPSMTNYWRSRDEQGVARQYENVPPGHKFSASSAHTDEGAREPYQIYAHRPPTFLPNPGFKPVHDWNSAAAKEHPERIVNGNYVGAACTHINKLVLFDDSRSVSEVAILEHFKKYCGIVRLSKQTLKVHQSSFGAMYWVEFANNVEVQKALDVGVSQWQGPHIRMEVPRQFWRSDHANYPGFHPMPEMQVLAQIQSQSMSLGEPSSQHGKQHYNAGVKDHRSGDTTSTAKPSPSELGGKQQHSSDSTPTSSASNTPKKDGNRPKKQHKNKSKREHEQKTEAFVTAPLPTRGTKPKVDGIGVSVSPTSHVGDLPSRDLGSADTEDLCKPDDFQGDSLAADARKPSASSENAQTKSEPGFSPEVEAKAQLPPILRPSGVEHDTITEHIADTASATDVIDADGTARARNHEGNSAHIVPPAIQVLQKVDEEQADDSFHTATSSPDGQGKGQHASGDGVVTQEAEEKMPTSAKTSDHNVTHPELASTKFDDKSRNDSKVETLLQQQEKAAPSTSAVAAAKKAPVPQKPLSVKTAEPTQKRGDETARKASESQRSASGPSVPPTPAFHTAPSTPALFTESPTSDKPEKMDTNAQELGKSHAASSSELLDPRTEEAAQSGKLPKAEMVEKAEKARGPSQTESLNPFAKPAQKKKPKSKKGTLRGKPKPGDFNDQAASRTVSAVVTPSSVNDEVPLTPYSEAGEGKLGSEATQAQAKPALSAAKSNDKDTADSTTSGAFSPTKSSSAIGNLVQGISGSNQPTLSVQEDVVGDEEKSKAALSSMESEDDSADSSKPVLLDGSAASQSTIAPIAATQHNQAPFQPFPEGPDVGGLRDSGDSGGGVPPSDVDVGLGISTTDAVTEKAPKAGKKKQKKKKKKSKGDAEGGAGAMDDEEYVLTSTPATKLEPPRSLFAFEFTAPHAPMVSDRVSDTSSSTMAGEDVPTPSTTSSVQASSPSRKRILAEIHKKGDNIVQPKPFSRKMQKRITPLRSTVTLAEDEDGEIELVVEDEGESGEPHDDSNERHFLYLYAGSGELAESEDFVSKVTLNLPALVDKVEQQRLVMTHENVRPGASTSAGQKQSHEDPDDILRRQRS